MMKSKLFSNSTLLAFLWPLAQVVIYYVRFGDINRLASGLDYVFFYLAGFFASLVFFYWLGKSSGRGRSWVIGGFVLSLPFSIFGTLGGGLFGVWGVILFSVVPVGVGAGLGYFVGKRQ